MATTKAKRSVHKKQSIGSTYHRKLLRFPDAKGKTVEVVELSMATDYHAISINFQDKTCLHFSIDTGLTIRTDYSSWKTGNQRIIRAWPLIRSQR